MRVKLDNGNMDLVMTVVRREQIKIEDAINFLLNNPDIIVNTRGVLDGKRELQTACKKS
jgi:hypothetical protein